jgi:thiol-disulfide isomerase/thioredoxin
VLAGAAALVAVAGRDEPGPGAFAWTTRLNGTAWLVLALGVALAAVITIGGYAVLHVLRSYGRVLVRLESVEGRLRAAGFDFDEPDDVPELGLAPGTPAPDFRLPTMGGERLGLDDLLQPGNPLLLVFTSTGCGACSILMPTVARWQREHAGELTIALLNEGDADLIRAEAREHGLANVLVDAELATYAAYEANGTPSAVLVSADGRIASWLAAGSEWIETLVDQALHGTADASGLPIGAEAPGLRLEVLDGGGAALGELVDGPTVLLFWNPGCGFCRARHDDVLAWEASRPAEAPRLVVVSSGAVEDVRAEGFASTVLLDPEWALSTELGADGTPMALLVDGDGRVASRPASGGAAALELLGALAPAVAD